jgi:hypothetical protein
MSGTIIRLYGVWCGRCGHAGHLHNVRTGLTTHVDPRLRPCQTKPPTPMPETAEEVPSV